VVVLFFAGAAGAAGEIVAAGVLDPATGALGDVEPETGVTCSTNAVFASVTFATNSA
jgi:hypothetical protein